MIVATEYDLARAKHINSPQTNPWLKKPWDAAYLVGKAGGLSPQTYELWTNAIYHLQKFAWRFHSKTCATKECTGCGDGLPLDQSKIKLYFHKKQAEYLCYEGREGWMITGRRFGKTEVGVFFVICKILGYNPVTHELTSVPQTWWLIGLDFPMIRDALIPTFERLMPKEGTKWSENVNAWDIKKTDLIVNIFNGSRVGFKSNDSGVAKFQSVGLDGAHFDEEPDWEVYGEVKMRVIGGKELLIRGSMTPDPYKGLTWTYKKILKNDKRLADPMNLRVWTGSTDENPGMIKKVMEDFVSDLEPWVADVKLSGNYALGLGRCAFNNESLLKMLEKWEEPLHRDPVPGGILSIYEEPKDGVCYVIGADSAEGLESSDNSVGIILRRDTMKVVGVLVGQIEPDIFGKELVHLAEYYNNAWIVPEANNHGLTTIVAMRNEGYVNLFAEKSQEDLAGVDKSRRMGWYTNIITRPILVDAMSILIREQNVKIPDKETLDECCTFIINAKGKAEAQSGCKDDRVMALGLAIQGHIRCPMDIPAKKVEERKKKTWWDDPENEVRSKQYAWMTA